MLRFDVHHPIFQDTFVLSGTGARTFNLHSDKVLSSLCHTNIDKITHEIAGPKIIVSGGAQGWDRYMTKLAVQVELPFVLVIPSPEYPEYYWGPRGSPDGQDHMQDWEAMEKRAAEVFYAMPSYIGSNGRAGGSNIDRNVALVEIANHFLVWNIGSPGTADCLRRIKRARTPFTDMAKEYKNQCGSTLRSA